MRFHAATNGLPAAALLFTMLFAMVLGLGQVWGEAPSQRTIRIGYQKYGTLVFEKARGTLEKKLTPMGVRITWTEFLGGPALLEAMGADSLDFGITGDAPPIFAQAAGVPLVYVGVEPASPHGEAIIVPEDSSIRTVADLKGRRVALNKGSNVHNLLVRVLAANGMSIADVQAVYLKPSDARAAFENGSVDAWAQWDPYLAAAQTALKTRTTADGVGRDGRMIDENREFFLAARDVRRGQSGRAEGADGRPHGDRGLCRRASRRSGRGAGACDAHGPGCGDARDRPAGIRRAACR